jgi:hypothetical protein
MITSQIILVAPFSLEPQNFRNRWQQIFRNHHPECTRTTVLTTRWCDGAKFEDFLRAAPDERRKQIGRLLVHVAHLSVHVLACINADPHPGNYLFPAGGGVALIDFGCVRRFALDFVEAERELVRVVITDTRSRFEDAVARTGMLRNPRGFDFDLHWRMLRHQWEPYCRASYRITPEYVRRGMAFAGPSNPNLRRLAIPPSWVWLQRLEWGLHSVLARFAVDLPYRAILCDILDRPVQPLGAAPGADA